ncbi:MAG: homocysteine S-methyltransferase family protein, partial [Rhodanobacter sp.]|nr:homocysteine S-methyltransferase family protein [Rhodanobacter sp.]
MKRRNLIVSIVVVAVVLAVAMWALQSAPRPVDVASVRRGPLVQHFEEEGRTELPRRWLLSAPITGTLQRINLLQGDAVKAGQVLAVIEPARAALLDPANRGRLLAEEQAAKASMQAARQRQAAAQADADLATRDVRRMRVLGASGAVSVAALDEAEAAVAAHGSGRIAGALGPLGASYRPDICPEPEVAAKMYAENVAHMKDRVDFFLIETAASVAQAEGALRAVKGCGKPYWLSVTVMDDDGTRLRSGEGVGDLAQIVADYAPEAVLVNCSRPEAIAAALEIVKGFGRPFGAYA